MPRLNLTAKQTLGLSFALYVFVFLTFLATLFFFAFRNVLLYQLKRDMSFGIAEILTEHLAFENGKMVFFQDAVGNEIGDELLRTGFSGVFLDKDLNFIKGYGVFSLYDVQDKNVVAELLAFSKQAVETKKVQQVSLMWQNQRMFVFFVPLIADNTVLGISILGKPFSEVDTITHILVILFGTFGVFAVLASFILGYMLSAKSFSPIHKFNKVIDEVDLDRLDKTLSINGHTNDELVILAAKINTMLARIKAMAGQQKEFISNVSHELRTPLTRAVSSLEVLDPTADNYAGEVTVVKEDLMEISTMLEKLLFLSKLRKDDIVKGDKVKLAILIEDLTKDLRKELDAKKIRFNSTVSTDIELGMPYEYAKVLFSNLLTNSVKYSRNGKRVWVKSERVSTDDTAIDGMSNTTVKVTITDEGVGMSQEELAKVFDRFYRGREGKELSYGSGIGLSIVKRLCDLYDVALTFSSTPGKGSTVELVFKV